MNSIIVSELYASIGVELVIGIIGILLGILLKPFLPERLRITLLYWGNRLKKYISNDNYRLQLASKYELEEEMPASDFNEELSKQIGESADRNGRFCFDYQSGSIDVDVVIIPQYESAVNPAGEVSVDTESVKSVTVEYKCSPNYRNLTGSLLDLRDVEVGLIESVAKMGASRQSTVVKCELSVKPTIQKIMDSGNIETLTGTLSGGDRITLSDHELQVHTGPDSGVTSTVKRAIVHYA